MKKVILSLLSVCALVMFISCGSKPTEEGTLPEAPAVEDTVETFVPPVEVFDNEATIALIDEARALAIKAGAEDKAPELLKAIDDYYAELKAKGDSINSAESAELVARYKALAAYIKAREAKQDIDDNDYASYNQKAYDEGVASLAKLEAAYENGDNAVTYAADADAAYVSFTAVLNVAYKKLAKAERDAAYEAKKQADGVKAAVSRSEEYKAATASFQKGDTVYAMQNSKAAYDNYKSAKETYLKLYNEIYEKRAAAQAAIEAAKKRVAESEQYAIEADTKAPLTEKVEGIEDEDANLLEEDAFKNPEDAEIDVAETIEEAMVEKAEEVIDSIKDAK